MYHQKIPSYDGAQPFIYAVYCKEDEALAYPVLARMYNEGFRVCCAPSTGISSDYYKQQRMQSASGLIMFMSHQMAERLRSGDPDVLAAARNPLLRTVILLDETDVKNNIFAMSVPDHQPYLRENDSAFWLYIYSNDYFDNCRGKWPEKQLLLRDPVYEDISEEVVSEEYRRLENIMTGSGAGKRSFDPFDPDTLYQNNPGYIEPEPDEFVYEPLERIDIVRTEQDDQFDEVLDLINQAENAVEESRRRTAEATAAAVEAAKSAADAATAQEEALKESISGGEETNAHTVDEAAASAEEPAALQEVQPEPETEPKADLIVTPSEPAEGQEMTAPEAAEEPAEVEVTPVTKEESAAAAETILASAEMLREEDNDTAAEPAEVQQPAQEEVAAEPVAAVAPAEVPQSARRSSVPVMVRRQQAAVRSRVELRKRRTVHVSPTPARAHRSAMHLSSIPTAEGILPHAISNSITFEQYVRNIARSYVNELLDQPEEQAPAAPARKHRQRVSATMQTSQETQPQQPAEPVTSEADGEETKSARKNRHPHQKGGIFVSIINALRSERRRGDDAQEDGGDDSNTVSFAADTEIAVDTVISMDAPLVKDNTSTDSFKENTVPATDIETSIGLQSVVEKFIECNRVPSITVVPRTMIRRYRD